LPNWIQRIIRASIRYPISFLLFWGVIATIALFGIRQLTFDTTTESVLDRSDPAWQFYRDSTRRFGGDEIIVVAIRSKEPWDPKVLQSVMALGKRIGTLSGVRRVDSLATIPLVHFTKTRELNIEPPLAAGIPFDEHARKELIERVNNDRIASGNLVSDDGRVFAINVFLDHESGDSQAYILDAIRSWTDPASTWISGVPVFRTQVNARTRQEVLIFVPITVIVIGAFLVLVFGSIRSAVISLLASGIGTLIPLGLMGSLGTPLTISTMILPSILLALGSAYIMHVLSVARGPATASDREEQILSVGGPILLSGMTTAIGFIALSTIRIDALRDLGGYGALGVLAALGATLTFVPALLEILPVPIGRARIDKAIRFRLRDRLVQIATEHARAVLALWFLVLALSSLGLARLHVETDAVIWFPKGSSVRDSYDEIREHLSGISPMNIVIEAQDDRPVTSPEVLNSIASMSDFLEGMPEVGRAVSFADPLKQLHVGFRDGSGDDLPNDSALIEQYVLLLSSSDYLEDLISIDRKRANVSLRVNNNGSIDLLRVARAAESWWANYGAKGFSATSTGIMYEFARSEDEIAWGQVRGLVTALAAISLVLFAIFRWPLLAGIAVLPNLIPLTVVFGGMGILGVPLDAVTVGLGSMALGIAVDDTIHVVDGYRTELESGVTPIRAIHATFERVLPPLIFTTVAISGGFLVLGLSDFTVTRNLGFITAGTVALCLVADLTLLPTLLVSFVRARRGVNTGRGDFTPDR